MSKDAYFFSGDNGVGFTYNLTEPSASAEVGFLPCFVCVFLRPLDKLTYPKNHWTLPKRGVWMCIAVV